MQKIYNIDLARANREALGNIYSLLKLNIKSCKAKGRMQRELWKNNNRSNKKKNSFARAAHFFFFFAHFFAVVLQDYNVKRQETSWLHVIWRKCRTCSCFTFSLPLIFSLVAASISHFLTAAVNLCSFNIRQIKVVLLTIAFDIQTDMTCRLLTCDQAFFFSKGGRGER